MSFYLFHLVRLLLVLLHFSLSLSCCLTHVFLFFDYLLYYLFQLYFLLAHLFSLSLPSAVYFSDISLLFDHLFPSVFVLLPFLLLSAVQLLLLLASISRLDFCFAHLSSFPFPILFQFSHLSLLLVSLCRFPLTLPLPIHICMSLIKH
jgi:hypothetical protein